MFGYAFPGSPRRAALLAYRDASLSHRANGIYGDVGRRPGVHGVHRGEPGSVHPGVAAARTTDVPARGGGLDGGRGPCGRARLGGGDRRPRTAPSDHERAHTINNAGGLTAAVLWGDGDFSATVGYAAQACLDADSIGATAGSWAGAFLGEQAIPACWIEPLHGRTHSAIFGFSQVALDELAQRTLGLVARFR